MKAHLAAVALLLFAAFGLNAQAQERAAAAAEASASAVTVVELYTSQGCFSCPRANRLVRQFTRDHNVLALTFPVGYWDYLGWADTFARPEFVDRQRLYSRALHFRAPYTPQLIIDGARQVSAASWDLSRAVFDEVRTDAVNAPPSPRITLRRMGNDVARVEVSRGAHAGQPADIWFVSYDPGPLTVLITRGENANRRVTHYNLVQRIVRAGEWNGEATWFERAQCRPECAVLVQEPNGGPILAAAFTQQSN